jgi:glycosyltransferase involved in cell wall biosynthesis
VPSVLIVSKPLVPPWNDSSKNLARDVARHLSRFRPITFDAPTDGKLRVVARMGTAKADVFHFFFAPNPKSSSVARGLSRLRRRPTVQTVCSRPKDMTRATRWLFADRTVVLSRATEAALLEAGQPAARLRYVAPCVPPLEPLSADARAAARESFELDPDATVIVFPGDLEFGDGAATMIEGFARAPSSDAILVMACRPKTPAAADAETELRARADALGVADRVRFVGETRAIHALLGCADIVALPSTDLYAKMDLPLVLIEAMWMARAVLVVDGSPAAELAEGGAAHLARPGADGVAEGLGALRDPTRRAQLGAAAREAAAARYHPEAMVRAYEAIYDELLSAGGKP